MGGIAIVGGGPAGLSAALSAYRAGARDIVLFERGHQLGGILPQCIHDGFGLHIFRENLTGPEYAQQFIDMLKTTKVKTRCATTVLSIDNREDGYIVTTTSALSGVEEHFVKAVILATGCYERPRGGLRIPGTRPSGIYTAGTVQTMMNIQNIKVGNKAVILGFGDIGLIMARRLTLEGTEVVGMFGLEVTGLRRNMVSCVEDYNIPYYPLTTVTEILGKDRVSGVVVTHQITGKEKVIDCDTLILAVGLIGESTLGEDLGLALAPNGSILVGVNASTSYPGVFACGNVTEVYDLVDRVTSVGERAGISAANFVKEIKGDKPKKIYQKYTLGHPYRESAGDAPSSGVFCTVCPIGCVITQKGSRFVGNKCKRGLSFAKKEINNPVRVVTTTVKYKDNEHLLPVKTAEPVAKELVFNVIKECKNITVTESIRVGDIIKRNIGNTGVSLIATQTKAV